MTSIFGIDAASFQGNVDWARVDSVCEFGAEKVTEGTDYVNPYWPVAKAALAARAKATGFVPMAYLFLDAVESGAAQAEYFASKAGQLIGWGIVVDLERAPNGSPSIAQARDARNWLKKRYTTHPIGGYAPHWYTGSNDLSFFDWTWASSYVGGSGNPAVLYHSVPASWWAEYGGKTPTLLQFTNRAVVPGVQGQVDCSAFRGTAGQLARVVLPAVPPPPPPSHPVTVGAPVVVPVTPVPPASGAALVPHASTALMFLAPGEPVVSFPVHAQQLASEPAPWSYCSLVLAGDAGAVVQAVLHHVDGTSTPVTVPLTAGKTARVNVTGGWGQVDVVTLRRLDTKKNLGATARFITW